MFEGNYILLSNKVGKSEVNIMGYKQAQICLNGHIINGNIEDYPESNQNYCELCGSKTITECPHCKYHIKGDEDYGIGYELLQEHPAYCTNCGSPFPWTEEAINSAKELASILDELTYEEQEELKKSLDDLVNDGPRTVVATTKFKRILSKTTSEISSGFREILVDVVSETVKKSIWG